MRLNKIIAACLVSSTISAFDVCDINALYNVDGYQYSLPRPVLESFLSGKAFDNPQLYTEKESTDLKADINELYGSILSHNLSTDNWAVMTAGAPGSGKTTLLRQDLEKNKSKNYAYICPDDVCLRNQWRTYKVDIEVGDKSVAARQMAYNKWRPGSNAAAHLILGNLIREKYAFYFGTTSTGPATGKFFDFLKKQGYKIRLIYVSAPEDVRWDSIKERDKTFVQTTEQDVREKGLLLPARINDTFLAYADEIDFYYRDGVKQNAVLAAQWIRSREDSGILNIVSLSGYEKIKAIHNAAVELLNRPDLYWEYTVELTAKITV